MSLSLKLVAVEFPVDAGLEFIQSFVNSHDKLTFNPKLLQKTAEA